MPAQPRIVVHAGPSLDSLKAVKVNEEPTDVSSSEFEGAVAVRIQDYLGPEGQEGKPAPSAKVGSFKDGATWSIVIKGRFTGDQEADEIMWGNCWSKPIRDSLPYGTSAALKFVHIVDPALEQDVYADKPWALSPLLATMNYVSTTLADSKTPLPDWSPTVDDDIVPLFSDGSERNRKLAKEVEKGAPAKRKKLFNDATKRKQVTIPAGTIISADFCNGYIDFKTLSLKLPGGLHFALASYWDGQPVTFVARNRSGSKEFFFVTLQIVKGSEKGAKSEDAKLEKDGSTEEGENVDELGVD
ncbi:hypothetical protein MNV49_000588 [Pseudohyphozyma bogoriensis]|nr:hypothetical protein MNV49_000588 [Pseudohyphozyma bogoriensis]